MLCPMKFNKMNDGAGSEVARYARGLCQCEETECAWWSDRIVITSTERVQKGSGIATGYEKEHGCALKILSEKN